MAAGHRVLAVFTQPDRPQGTRRPAQRTSVKEAALRLGLPVHQPERIRRPEIVEHLRGISPKPWSSSATGKSFRRSIIDIPPRGIINVHASLLPKYRGAAPIQWAIANGETRTGVTTMRIDAGLDTGDMLLKWETDIGAEETALELSPRLARAGADLLVETLKGLAEGTIAPQPQDSSEASLAPILKKEDGAIDWSWPAPKNFQPHARLAALARGVQLLSAGSMLHIWRARGPSEPRGPAWPACIGEKAAYHRVRRGHYARTARSANRGTQAHAGWSLLERPAAERK